MQFTTNQNILDILQLYEYSMSIGRSLDCDENCNQFLRLVLKRKNLNACWILECEENSIKSIYSLPKAEKSKKILDSKINDFLKSQTSPYFVEIDDFHKTIAPIKLDKGYICMHPLSDSKFLFLYSKNKPIEKNEIVKLSPVIDKFGKTLKACKAHSNQAQILQKLEERNHELNDYAHVVSHDLKSPLRNIETMISWIEEELSEKLNNNSSNYLNHVRENITKMEGLISDILSYSTVGSEFIRETNIDMNKCLEELIDYNFTPDHIKIQIKQDLPIIKGDTYRIEQLFQNLITNAIKYNNKEHGLVEISYQDLDQFHQFSVRDNGIGIEPKYHDKIFQTFQKLHEQKDSSGVGLSIVKRIVQSYGGEIWLNSELGRGTTFTFTLKKLL